MRSDRYKDEPIKNKKKRGPLRFLLILILLLIVSIAALTAYLYKSAFDSLSVTFTDETPLLNFGEDYHSMDFVKESCGEITPSLNMIDTGSVGMNEITYTAEAAVLGGLFKPSKEFTLTYDVVDTVPPLKIWGGDGSVIALGTEFDINDCIAYGDNADPTPLVSVDGKVDTGKTGDYPLHVKVTDASGNVTEWDLTVTVADELPSYTDDTERTAFKDFVSANKGKGRSFGIDVSAWQDDIDFKAVKAAGCEFVMIRIGYTYDGEINIDKTYYKNLEGARAAGLKIGIYMYCADSTAEQVRNAADWISDTIKGTNLDFPVAFDWEDFGDFQDHRISFYELNKLYDAFADELAQSGYGCMLYGSKYYLENVWNKTDTRPVWLAHYIEKTDYKGPYMMWQASSTGRISGIDGDVDMDILYTNN